jgi:hypothetical protein
MSKGASPQTLLGKGRQWQRLVGTAGEIALKTAHMAPAKAQAYFERGLAVARERQVKSWELRAATSMARATG